MVISHQLLWQMVDRSHTFSKNLLVVLSERVRSDNEFITRGDDEPLQDISVRYRTVGDMTCTGAVESTAATISEVIAEIAATRITERGQTRADDRTSEAAMEDRKREGYF